KAGHMTGSSTPAGKTLWLSQILNEPLSRRSESHSGDSFRETMHEISRCYRARVKAAKSEENKYAETKDWGKWGFVVFCTAPYGGEHETQWAKFRRLWWVEQPESEGVDVARFNEIALPQGLATSACLMLLWSLLSPSSMSRRERQSIAFVVSVSQGASATHLPALPGLGDEEFGHLTGGLYTG
ncbi:hypothetical protein N7451_000489, partial [Penicillium sp. IBT 35674x]